MTIVSKILSAAAWAGLFCVTTSAQAETAQFQYRGGELQTTQGVNQLLKRLRLAARAKCRAEVPVITKAELQCREEVETQWILQIASPSLTDLSRSDPPSAAR